MNMRYGWLWLVLLFSLSSLAQTPYGNEWIRSDHEYLRLGITRTGWYRLVATDLQKKGVDLTRLASASLKLYRRGKEVPILIAGEQDGQLKPSDYIEFYGEQNDGLPDTLLYVASRAMPHPYYSLYSDTASYFLAWQAVGQPTPILKGKRIAQVTGKTGFPKIDYHTEEVLRLFTSDYPAGNIYPFGAGYDDGYINTPYDYGEGWTGPARQSGQKEVVQLQTDNPVREEFSRASLEMLFVGRNAGPHRVEVWTGDAAKQVRKLGEIRWQQYNTALFTASLLPEDLAENGAISVVFVPQEPGESVSCSYVRWRYPQTVWPEKIATQKMLYPDQNSSFAVNNASSLRFFEVTVNNIRQIIPDTSGRIATQNNSSLLVTKSHFSVTNINKIRFRNLDSTATDYLIISHPLVRKPVTGSADPVADYAAYRASGAGGGYRPLVLNASEVADQFNYGEPGPLGTKRLMRWLHDRGQLQYVFLIGKSRSPQIVRQQANARQEDMIPSAGWPDSDIALGMGLDPNLPDVPLVPIGRLNAYTAQNVWDYFQKVKQHEAAPPAQPWRKNILHLSGGRTSNELLAFRSFVDTYKSLVDSSAVAPRLQTLSKRTTEPVERFDLAPILNEGVALMTLFGHSSLTVTDIDIGLASNDALGYRNKGRYPAVLVNGCALGNFYFGPRPLSTDWILAPDRGAVLFLAHTHNGLTPDLYGYSQAFYSALADPALVSQPFGDIMREGTRRFLRSNTSLSARITAQQMNLQGDPAIRIFPATRPDYAWESATVRITNAQGRTITAWDDSIRIQAEVTNQGRYLNKAYTVRVRRMKNEQTLSEFTVTRPAIPLRDTLRLSLPNLSREGGDETWELSLDPGNAIPEENETNNLFTLPVQVENGGAIALLPANHATLRTPQVELVAQVPASRAGSRVVFEWGNSETFGPDTRRDTLPASGVLARRSLNLPGASPQTVYWRVRIVGDPTPPYQVFRYDVQGVDSVPARPEGVATLSATPVRQWEEGALFSTQVIFENISPVPFTDSIQVLVREFGGNVLSEKRFYIAPLAGKANYQYAYTGPTLGKGGSNQVLIYFNAGRLPEQLYINNAIALEYEVLPDRVPPVLDVLIDGRRLSDREAVGPAPRLQARIFDSNQYLMRSDTTGIRISLKQECEQCPTVAVSLAKAEWSFRPATDFTLALNLPTLAPGTYILMVEARDYRGNEAAPYVIRFRVAAQNQLVTATVTPNPASLWVKFGLELEGTAPPLVWRVRLFDLNGRPVATLEKQPTLGKNELFWVPAGLAPGLYLYRMDLEGTGWPTRDIQTGKIVIVP